MVLAKSLLQTITNLLKDCINRPETKKPREASGPGAELRSRKTNRKPKRRETWETIGPGAKSWVRD